MCLVAYFNCSYVPTSASVIVVSDDQDPGEPDAAVMALDLQDPALRKIYKGLPVLPFVTIFFLFPQSFTMRSFSNFCDVYPFSKYGGGEACRVNFSLLYGSLDKSSRR